MPSTAEKSGGAHVPGSLEIIVKRLFALFVAESVERDPFQQIKDAALHLNSRFIGERDRQDTARRDAGKKKFDVSARQGVSLA